MGIFLEIKKVLLIEWVTKIAIELGRGSAILWKVLLLQQNHC